MKLLILILAFILISCGNYSFSGKSIPPGIKNAQLLLLEDNSGRYDLNLPGIMNEKIIMSIENYNYFLLENSPEADSRIFGRIRSYTERFVSQTRDEVGEQTALNISVEISFLNNLNDEFVVRSLNVSETEYYDASGGDAARNEAFEKLTDRLADSIVLGLSSNW